MESKLGIADRSLGITPVPPQHQNITAGSSKIHLCLRGNMATSRKMEAGKAAIA